MVEQRGGRKEAGVEERRRPSRAGRRRNATPEQRKARDAKLENPEYAGKELEKKDVESKQEDSGPPRQPRPVLGYALAGAGVVALGIGTYFGLKAISDRNESSQHCGPTGCTQQGVDLNQSAKGAAWASDFGIGLGIVGVAVGGYMLLKPRPPLEPAPESTPATSLRVVPRVSASAAGVEVGGAW